MFSLRMGFESPHSPPAVPPSAVGFARARSRWDQRRSITMMHRIDAGDLGEFPYPFQRISAQDPPTFHP